MDTRSFATRIGILAVCAATLYATTFGGYPFFKTWAAVLLGLLLIYGIAHTMRSYLKFRAAKSANDQIEILKGAMLEANDQRDQFGGLGSMEGRNRFAQAVRRAAATQRNIIDRASQLKMSDEHGHAPSPGATWKDLELAAQGLVKQLRDAHYWCDQELRSSFAPGLLSPDFHPETFNNSQQQSANEAMHRATVVGRDSSASGDHTSWMRPQSHNRGYPTMHAAPTTRAARPVRPERKVVNMSEYEYLRRRNPGPHAGQVVYFPTSRTGRRR